MAFRVKDILKIQVAPALGCTEPVAIALGSAAAVSLLPERRIDAIEIWVDPNIYKNGLAVSIPGTDGLSGLDMASALGAMGGDPKLRLEVLDSVDEAAVTAAIEMVKAERVTVNLLRDQVGLHIRTVVNGGGHTAESVITGLHDNVVSLILDGQPIEESDLLPQAAEKNGTSRLAELEAWLKALTLDQLIELLDDLDDEDRKFLQAGVDVNLRLADYGLKHGPGLGVGRTMERLVRQGLIKRDMLVAARILASSAADARMSGVKLPAMSSAGSGNHGLTAILPIVAVEEFISVDHALVIEAIGLSHIITAYVKAYTGRAVRHLRLQRGRRGRGNGRHYLPDGRHQASHCRCHKESYRGPGRRDLRRRQGRMRPEAGYRRRNGRTGGPFLASGGQCQLHRRHHRALARGHHEKYRHPHHPGNDRNRPHHPEYHAGEAVLRCLTNRNIRRIRRTTPIGWTYRRKREPAPAGPPRGHTGGVRAADRRA